MRDGSGPDSGAHGLDAAGGGDGGPGGAGGLDAGNAGDDPWASRADAGGSMPDTASPPYCGDGIRELVREECDDGSGGADDTCSDACRARSIGALPASLDADADAGAPSGPARLLPSAAHAADGTFDGMAAVLVEDTSEARVLLQRFDAWGGRRGDAVELSAEAVAVSVPSPAVAALPEGRYVVALTEVGAGSPDVALVSVDAQSGAIGSRVIANQVAGGPQEDADLVWTGSELVVAWTDLFDVYIRRFDEELLPLGNERVFAGSDALETSATLAVHDGDVACAWKSNRAGQERTHALAAGVEWWTTDSSPLGEIDRPGLVSLDDEHLLLTFTLAVDGGGSASTTEVRMAVLAADAPGEIMDWPLMALGGADDPVAQRRPRAARVGERTYVAWERDLASGDHEIVLQELDVSALEAIVPVAEWRLPIDPSGSNDQRNPALAASPLAPDGALIALWEDHSGTMLERPVPDVMLHVRPSPIVELD